MVIFLRISLAPSGAGERTIRAAAAQQTHVHVRICRRRPAAAKLIWNQAA
jgi:hypothetical protein